MLALSELSTQQTNSFLAHFEGPGVWKEAVINLFIGSHTLEKIEPYGTSP